MGFTFEEMPFDDPDLLEEMHIADTFFKFMVELMGSEINEGRVFTDTFPYRFGALNSQAAGEVQGTLEYMRACWEALEKFEAAAGDENVANVVLNAVWPSQGWTREIFIAALENNFESMPRHASAEILDAARAQKTTKSVEDEWRELREAERQHTASKLGKVARWHRCIQSAVLPEADRRRLDVLPVDREVASTCSPVTDASFSAKTVKPSIPDLIDRFLGPKTWASPPPDSFHLTSNQTSNMLLFDPAAPAGLEKVWMSLLAEKRTFLIKRGAGAVRGLVVCSSPTGVVLLQGTWAKNAVDANFWYRMPIRDETVVYKREVITNAADYIVMDLQALPPGVTKSRFKAAVDEEARALTGVVLVLKSGTSPMKLVEFAASRAFYTLNCKQMKDLGDQLGVEWARPKPRTEFEICRAVMQDVLPTLSLDQIDAIIDDWRNAKKPSVWTSSFDPSNVDLVCKILDDDAAKEARRRVAAKETDKEERQSKMRKAIAKKTGRAKAKPRLRGGPMHHEFSQDEAKVWIPGVSGCTLTFDDVLHMRWKISYPNSEAPFSTSCVWGPDITSRTALFHCLQWAWECHQRATGEECPFDFSE
jgi:hypothetical protein